MKAGRLRNRITLQKNESGKSPTGAPINKWVDIATVWAEVTSISGKELLTAQSLMQSTTIRIWIRYRDDLDTSCRIIHHQTGTDKDALDIKAILPDAKKTRLEILCEGGLNNG